MQLNDHSKWRYATKKMDSSKKVSDSDINEIKESIQLAASSYGLQPYSVIEVKDAKLREDLKPICWGQTQVTDASNLFIFCNHTEVSDNDVDALIKLKAEINGMAVEDLSGYGDFIKGKLKDLTPEQVSQWTAKQTYIALGNALNACAELKVDSTPMEGFEAEGINQLLNLSEKGLNACVVLAVGYRAEDDASQFAKKVRKPIGEIFSEL
ncbi:MAG: NAD(P)H-dependent oxidoreductase [Flavobacteriales bacterium]|nr:NAD(P)H-dependent oxidoreductase [Flavobacteriales bacterium]